MVRGRLILALACLAVAPAVASDALDLAIGKALFERNWVSAPASTKADDGLGPLFDATSCAACHVDGARLRTEEDGMPTGMVIRLGNAQGGGDPVYGRQLQTRAVTGVPAEAAPDIAWTSADALRRPAVTLHRLGYGPLDAATKLALRRPPALNGTGLLARVPDGDILKGESATGDGVSGRAAWLADADGTRRLGRFGWKATEPDLAAQTEIALSRDMGMSTVGQAENAGECSSLQTACRAAPHGAERGEVEIPDRLRDLIVAFLESRPAPAAAADPDGESLFAQTGCAACHATLQTGMGEPVRAYTDLLLHDMGEELADGIAEGAASAREWRTAPLWGLAEAVRRGGLLHDGRARTVEEAIDWHGGEGANARARFRSLRESDKSALLRFLSGL